jgi:hypothetical protein
MFFVGKVLNTPINWFKGFHFGSVFNILDRSRHWLVGAVREPPLQDVSVVAKTRMYRLSQNLGCIGRRKTLQDVSSLPKSHVDSWI